MTTGGLTSRGARWGLWIAFAAGVLLSVARVDLHALQQPVIALFLASSALGFRFAGRR